MESSASASATALDLRALTQLSSKLMLGEVEWGSMDAILSMQYSGPQDWQEWEPGPIQTSVVVTTRIGLMPPLFHTPARLSLNKRESFIYRFYVAL